jgi:hypothetical protein
MEASSLMPILLYGASGATGTVDPVEAGRKALSPWQGYPWYDKHADRLVRIKLARPREELPSDARTLPIGGLLQTAAWLMIGALLGSMVYFLVRYWLRLGPAAPRRKTGAPQAEARIEALPEALRPASGDLLAAAREHYAAGDYSRAVLYLFAHQLVELDRHQAIRLERGKTNRQYLRELKPQPGLREVFAQSMVAFEDVFFGRQTIERPRCDACWQGQSRLETLLGGQSG